MGLNPDLKNEEGLDMQLQKQGFHVTASSMYEVVEGAVEPWGGGVGEWLSFMFMEAGEETSVTGK